MTDAYDDLFGEPEPPKRRPGRPTREEAERKRQEAIQKLNISVGNAARGRGLDDLGGAAALLRPVTKHTLAEVFRMDEQTVKKRLARCPYQQVGNRQLYDFVEAASFIVKPQMTPQEFIRTLNTSDLPPQINKFFWDSQRTRIRFKLEAQEAWDTEDVLEVFGDVFMTVKDVLQMATEEIRERAKLTDEQAKLFEAYIDELRDTLRTRLCEMPQKKQTRSLLEQPLFGTSKDVEIVGDVYAEMEEDDGE